MYQSFYGLKQRPFELTPVGGLVYLSESHKEGIAILRYGIIADKGFALLTGGVGTGKTTILNTLLLQLKNKVITCVINNPTLTRNEFYHYLGQKFGIDCKSNKSEFILQFSDRLALYDKKGYKVLLIIDEAQAFSIELLEEIRLLSNIGGEKNIFSTFLIGQPELQQKLAHPKLLPLRQRIAVTYHLEPLTREDTSQYIAYRLNHAGAANPAFFSKKAIGLIYKASHGNPRLINIICDNSLVQGYCKEVRQIDHKIIADCIKTLKFKGEDSLKTSESVEQITTHQGQRFSKRQSLQSIVHFMIAIGLLTSFGFAGFYAYRYLLPHL